MRNDILIIVFTDDRIVKMTDTLAFLRDYCEEHGNRIVVIGKREAEFARRKPLRSFLPLWRDRGLLSDEKRLTIISI